MFYYLLKCKDENVMETYVGKTKQTLKKRFSGHKTICKTRYKCMLRKVHKYIIENGGIENWEIILLEENLSANELGIEIDWIKKCNSTLNTYLK